MEFYRSNFTFIIKNIERRVNLVKKLWSVAAVVFCLIVFMSYSPADAFNSEATLYLAQATQETPKGKCRIRPAPMKMMSTTTNTTMTTNMTMKRI